MEDTCGRCLYYDEIMKEYAADNSPRLEHLKQISWDQQAQHNRTIQVKLGNGSEMYKTSLINTIHVRTPHSNTQTSSTVRYAAVAQPTSLRGIFPKIFICASTFSSFGPTMCMVMLVLPGYTNLPPGHSRLASMPSSSMTDSGIRQFRCMPLALSVNENTYQSLAPSS